MNLDAFEVYDEKYVYLDEKLKIRYTELKTETKDVRIRYMSEPKEEKDFLCEEGKVGECRPYFQIRIRSNGKLTTIYRVYPKALEIFGEFGGMISLLMSVLGIVYFLFHSDKSSNKIKGIILGEE